MKEKLGFGHLGNGVTIWDSLREVNGDYLTLAHIAYDRRATYYQEVSPEAKTRIDNFARYGNMTVSVTQPDTFALQPLSGSAFMSPTEKTRFLRDYQCSADGVEPFIRMAWDDTLPPLENLALFHQWWADGKAREYLG